MRLTTDSQSHCKSNGFVPKQSLALLALPKMPKYFLEKSKVKIGGMDV